MFKLYFVWQSESSYKRKVFSAPVGLSNLKQCFNEVCLSLLRWSVVGKAKLSLRVCKKVRLPLPPVFSLV